MRLSELLTPARIDVRLAASSKREALRRMAELLAHEPSALDRPVDALRVEDLERVLVSREEVASTGVGDGVAIPHGRLPGLTTFVGALAIRKAGVPFDAVDGQPASILFALVGPERAAGEHLKCLARISRLLRDESARLRLLSASTPEQAHQVVVEFDG